MLVTKSALVSGEDRLHVQTTGLGLGSHNFLFGLISHLLQVNTQSIGCLKLEKQPKAIRAAILLTAICGTSDCKRILSTMANLKSNGWDLNDETWELNICWLALYFNLSKVNFLQILNGVKC